MEDNHGRQQQQMLQWQQPQQLWQSMQPEQWQHQQQQQQQQQQAMQQPQQQSMQQLQQQQAAMQQLQQQMKSQQLQQQAMLPLQQQQWQQQQAVKPMKPPPPAPTLPLEFFRSAPSLDAHLSATISRTALESTHHLEPLRTSSIVPLPSCISHTHSQSLSLSRRSTASLPSQLPQASPFQQAALSLQPSQQQQTDQLPQSGYEVGGSATQGSHCVSASGSPNPMAHAFRENSLSADPAWQGSICDATRMLTTKRPSTASRASSLVVAEAVESHRKATSMSYMGQGLEMGLEMERGLQAILLSPRSGVEMASQQAPQPEGPPLQHRVSITLQHGGTGSVASQHSVVGLGGSGVVTQGHPVNAMVQSQEAGMAAAAAGLDPAVMTQLMGVLQQRRAALQRVLADRQAGQQGMSQGQQSMSQEQQSMSQGQQGQQGMSSRQQSMPQGQQGMSLGQQSMPQGQQSMSPGHQGMSPRQQSTSQEQQSMSQGQQGMSPRQQGMPQGQQGMLQGQQGMPLNQQVLPMGQQVMFQGQQVASQGLQGMSQGQQGMPQGQQSMGGNSGFGFRGQGTGMAPAAEGVWPKITLAELQRANFQRSSSRRISSNVLSDIISPPVHGHIVSNRPSLSGHVSPPKRDSLTGMAMFTGMEFNPQPKRQSFNELHTLSDWQSPTSVRNSPNGLPGRPSPHEEALHGHLRPPGLPAVSQPPPPRLVRSGSRRGAYPEFVKDSHGSDVMGSLAAHDSSEPLPPGRSLRHTYSGQGSSTTYPSGPLANGFATIASIKQQHPNTSCPVLSPQYQHSNSNTPTTSSFHFNGQQVLGEASSPPNLQGVPWSPAVMGTWLPDQGMAMATPSMGAMYAGQRAGGNAFDGPGLRSSSYMGHGGLHEEADHERTLQAMVQLQALRELAATRALNGPRSPGGLAIMPTEGSNLPHRPLSTTFEEEPEEEDCGDASQGASKLMRKSVRMAETLQRGSSDGELPITRPLSAKLLRSLASSRRWSQSHSDTSEEVGVRPARSLHHRRRSSSPEYVLREDASSTSSDSFRRRHQTTDAEHVPRVALEAMRRSKSLHRSRSRAGALLDAEQEDLDPLAKMLLLQQGQPSEQHGSQSQQRAPQSAQHVAQSEQGAAQSEDRSTGSAQSIGSALEAERAKRVTQTLRRAAMLSHAIGIAVDDFH